MHKNILASGTSSKMGIQAEKRFDKIANRYRIYSRRATTVEDKQHIDRVIEYEGKKIPVEIKSMKKISRSDASPQDKYIWIELHGVHPNDKGWLYGGKSDLIAFEMKYGFLFVKRTDLIKLVNNIIDFKAMVSMPMEAVNKVYLRRASTSSLDGGHDKVTLVNSGEIEKIFFMRWKE